MPVYKETANDLHRELMKPYSKKPPFCLCARANRALRAPITRKILRSKDAQCKTEESPNENQLSCTLVWKVYTQFGILLGRHAPLFDFVVNENQLSCTLVWKVYTQFGIVLGRHAPLFEKRCVTRKEFTLLAKNFGRFIFGHSFPISDNFWTKISDILLKHCQSKFWPTKYELDWENVPKRWFFAPF